MFARNQEKFRAVIPAALAGIAVSLVLVWGMGLLGAAIALFLSNAFGLAASVIASRRFFRFDLPIRRIGLVGLAAVIGGLALQGGLYLTSAHGLLVQITVASLAFCVVYAIALTVQGVSLKSIASTPWAPVPDQAGTSAR
jgi:O-antigen/teichoic acid export membrane protein